MLDNSMFKCKLMEPRTGTGYTFSEQSEFHGTLKYTKKNNKPRLGKQGSLMILFAKGVGVEVRSKSSSDKDIV